MYKRIEWGDPNNTFILATRDDDTSVIIEPDSGELWALASGGSLGGVAAYTPPPSPSAEDLLEAERAAMNCTTAQMAVYLNRGNDRDDVELAFAAVPDAKDIWTKAVRIHRRGPVLEALQAVFTDAEIDDAFRAAKLIEI